MRCSMSWLCYPTYSVVFGQKNTLLHRRLVSVSLRSEMWKWVLVVLPVQDLRTKETFVSTVLCALG